jgi:hypothetical protein
MIDADPVAIALWATMVIGSYHTLEYLFPRLTHRFGRLKGPQRRYVIKNLLKSALLLVLGIAATPVMFRFFYHSQPDNEWIHTMGVLYAIPDVYALWWLRKVIYRSTVYHHISVALLATVGLFLDHNVETHWVAMLVYAYLSMWTGVVNFYLGARFILRRDDTFEDRVRRGIAEVSLWVYMVCCGANWLYQLHTVMMWLDFRWSQLSWGNFVGLIAYCAMLVAIIRDDLILMRKLSKECVPYRPNATLEEQAEHFKHTLQSLIEDEEGKWPVCIKSNSAGGMTVESDYPWPIDVITLFDKVKHFRTTYAVTLQITASKRWSFNVIASEPKE